MSENENNTPFSIGNVWFPTLSYNTFIPPKDKASEYSLGLTLDAQVENVEHLLQLEDGKHLYKYTVKYSVRNVNMIDQENKLVFEAIGLLKGDIVINEQVDDELMKKFVHANQNIATLPYIKNQIDMVLAKAGLPALGMLIVY